MYHGLLIPSSFDGHLECFGYCELSCCEHLCEVFMRTSFLFPLGKHLEVELLDHGVYVFVNF